MWIANLFTCLLDSFQGWLNTNKVKQRQTRSFLCVWWGWSEQGVQIFVALKPSLARERLWKGRGEFCAFHMANLLRFTGASALIMLVALMAYGREELDHSHPEKDVYSMLSEKLVEPDFKEALLGVSFFLNLRDELWTSVAPATKVIHHAPSCSSRSGCKACLMAFCCHKSGKVFFQQ